MTDKDRAKWKSDAKAVAVVFVLLLVGGIVWLASIDWKQMALDAKVREEEAAAEAARIEASKKRDVSREDFAEDWPLTVETGTLKNYEERSGTSAVFIHEGETYALNGTAITKGYKQIDPIWADNPKIPESKIGIGALRDAALELTPSYAPGVNFEKADGLNHLAYTYSQEFAKKHLKSPTSAEFPLRPLFTENDGKRSFTVKSYVDAQNSFGVALRKNYRCELERIEDGWRLVSFEFIP